MHTRRRDFLSGCMAFGGWMAAGAAGRAASPSYTVPILGDTHFDETEWGSYHVGWKPRDANDARDRRNEFARNAEMWKERLPRLIESSAACRRQTDAFFLQVGDLVQGDCADAETETRYFRDAVAACRKGFGPLPFLTVAGNHDVRNGGRAPYEAYFPPLISRELGVKVESTTFYFRQGPDAWIVADFMKPDVRRLFAALDETEGVRYTFLVCHSPVTPTDNWGFFWFLLGKPEDTAMRRKLRRRLMARRAIVLCGHTHCTELDEWRTDEGLLTQYTANSVWRAPGLATLKPMALDPDMWGKLWVEKHATDAPVEHDGHYTTRTRAESLELVREYRPGLVRYEKYAGAGHSRLDVSDAGVAVDFYGGDARVPSRRFVLR